MLYHVSEYSGIKVLRPELSSHGKAFVYAVDNLVTGLLFGARQDDFDFLIEEDNTGTPVVYECYPNAFQTIYQGKRCYVYELADAGFSRGMTNWDAELVCPHEIPVLNETEIDDLYQRLQKEVTNKRLAVYYYNESIQYKKLIAGHIVDRLIRFDALDKMEKDARGQRYFIQIIQTIKAAMDGSLL